LEAAGKGPVCRLAVQTINCSRERFEIIVGESSCPGRAFAKTIEGVAMQKHSYWADQYVEKKCTASEAIKCIRPGQRVFVGSSSGEPQHLVRQLAEAAGEFADLEIVRLLCLEMVPLSLIATKSQGQSLNIRSFYLGSAKSRRLARNARFITPMNLSAVPRLFRTKLLPIQVALIQTTPPDDFGWMSLGVSVDITLAAALSADIVIAQVNPRMPRVLGQSFIHVNDVDRVVEYEEPLLTIEKLPEFEAANLIGKAIARLIEDGSTVQISPGTTQNATLLALSDKNDLGIHTQFLTDEMMHLYARGVITNRKKGFNDGKLVASNALGSAGLYEFINDNPAIEFHPSDYVNDPAVIGRHNKMVAMNVAMAIDLTGQVAADALPNNYFSGVSGILDFTRGAFQSKGGKSILLLPSTSFDGKTSRVVPRLDETAVVVPRGDVQYVATEFGVVNLFGKSLQERALAMISIAHPSFRDELFHYAKQMNLLGPEKRLKDAIRSVYPLHLEQTVVVGDRRLTIRPAKPVDQRRIQEHFYNLDKQDVVARFFYDRDRFGTDEAEQISQVDYENNLTILAVVGDFGFGQVVGVGEYLRDPEGDMAEIAFSVLKPWQGKGIGKLLLERLAEGAREKGIAGFYAFTNPDNEAMIALFRSLSCEVETSLEEDGLKLWCRFDDRADAEKSA